MVFSGLILFIWSWWQKRGPLASRPGSRPISAYGRPLVKEGEPWRGPTPTHRCAVHRRVPARRVDADYLTEAVKPKQFIHIDQTECIICEGCVDICPWKCIHMVTPDAIVEAIGPSSRRGSRPTMSCSSSTTTSAPAAPLRRPLPDRRHHPRQGRHAERRPATPTPAPTARLRLRHEVLTEPHMREEPSTTSAPHGRRCEAIANPALKAPSRRLGTGQPGLEQHLPSRLDLPQGLHRQPAQPPLRGHELGAVPPAPRQGEAPRRQGQLHAVSRRAQLLPLHPADRHRHLPDVLLPAEATAAWNDITPCTRGVVRAARAQHASVGRAPMVLRCSCTWPGSSTTARTSRRGSSTG